MSQQTEAVMMGQRRGPSARLGTTSGSVVEEPWDVIVAADVCFDAEMIMPLADALGAAVLSAWRDGS